MKGDEDDFRRLDDGRETDFQRLGESGDPRAVKPLIRALGDGDYFVGPSAAKALGQLGDPRAIDSLIPQQRPDERVNTRRSAAEALGELGDPRALDPLIRALGDGDSEVRCSAAEALGKLGQRVWRDWVKGDEEDFRRLGESGDPRAVEPLIRALSDGEYDVRRSAAEALGQLGDERAVEPLIARLPEGNVGASAAKALGRLGDLRAAEPLLGLVRGGAERAALDLRQGAAMAIIMLVKKYPDRFAKSQASLHRLFTSPHADNPRARHGDNSGSSSDCTHSEYTHTDNGGVGLKLRKQPPKIQ